MKKLKEWKNPLLVVLCLFLIGGLAGGIAFILTQSETVKCASAGMAGWKLDVSDQEAQPDTFIEAYLKDGLFMSSGEEAAASEVPEDEPAEPDTEPVPVPAAEGGENPPQPTVPVDYPYYIKVNRQACCITIYGKDASGAYTVPVKAIVCSVGKNNATPLGVFHASTKYTWKLLNGNVYGQYAFRVHNGILFHSVPYYTKSKDNLKYKEYNKLGNPASQGCIRMSTIDAKWIYDNCPTGTTVEVYESEDPGPLGKPIPLAIDENSPYKGWDPTDPDTGNPWRNSLPIFAGVTNRTVERGSAVDVAQGVSATDYLGNPLTVTASGSVNSNKVGQYTVSYSTQDEYGNTADATAVFSVIDTTAPVVSCRGNMVITDADTGNLKKLLLANVTAADSGQPLSSNAITLNWNELSKATERGAYGVYTCSAQAKDESGNVSKSVRFTVTYKDVLAPVITGPDEVQITVGWEDSDSYEQVLEKAKPEARNTIEMNCQITDFSVEAPTTLIEYQSCDYEEVPSAEGGQIIKSLMLSYQITATDKQGNQASKQIKCRVTRAKQ